MNNKLTNLKKTLITLNLIILGLNSMGCSKDVECSVSDEHVHIYIDEDKNLKKYIIGEKDHKGNFVRTEDYVSLSNELTIVSKKDLLLVEDNIDYINREMTKYTPYREAYTYDYRYGYDFVTNEYDYHWDYDWDKIDMDKYTPDKVRDITYNYKLYKVNDDGKIEYEYFNSLDDAKAEYKYFKVYNVINKNTSDSYYLEKRKEYKNVR